MNDKTTRWLLVFAIMLLVFSNVYLQTKLYYTPADVSRQMTRTKAEILDKLTLIEVMATEAKVAYARQRIWLQEAVEESNRQRSELLEKTKDRYTSKNAEKDWNQFYEANPEVKRVGN